MGWSVPIQKASFRGVPFEVISITDDFQKVLAEHSYPFVNGADFEDMGLQARTVQVQAVFFGKGYQVGLTQLIAAIQEKGSAVLVHPIFGRMPNMICSSASVRHGDELINYAALDLTFTEVTEGKPIFVFEQSLWGAIATLLNQINELTDSIFELYGELMKAFALFSKGKANYTKAWSGVVGTLEAVRLVVDADPKKYPISAVVSVHTFEQDTLVALKALNEMISSRVMAMAFPTSANHNQQQSSLFVDVERENGLNLHGLTLRSRFDDVLRHLNQIKPIALELATGKNDTAQRSQKMQALMSAFGEQDVQEIDCGLSLICTATLVRSGVEMMERYAEELTPVDIEYINRQVRLSVVESIEKVRRLQQKDVATQMGQPSKPNTSIYHQAQQTSEQLRQVAHGVSQVAMAAINRKPPLMVRLCELNGTIHQVAHHFYGDYRRANELLRLNPQIQQPNFIQQGEVLNAYAK